jgi:hypothetical protein
MPFSLSGYRGKDRHVKENSFAYEQEKCNQLRDATADEFVYYMKDLSILAESPFQPTLPLGRR